MKALKILPLAAAGLALSLGYTGQAHAYAYAYSYLDINNFQVTVLPEGTTALTGFQTCVTSQCAQFATPVPGSTAQAALGGTGDSTNDPRDAAVALGDGSSFPDSSSPVNNSWTAEGTSNSHNYSWADSHVVSEQTLNTPPFNADGSPSIATYVQVKQIAEGNVTDSTLGTSGGETTSTTELKTDLQFDGDGGRVRFDFDAERNMTASITAPNTGIQARAISNMSIVIRDKVTQLIVFQWIVGAGISGGSVLSEPTWALSTQVSTVTPGTATDNKSSTNQAFQGITNDLPGFRVVGTPIVYELVLTATVSETVQATDVPAPGPLALMALGMLGMGSVLRRTKKSRLLAA